MLKLESTWGLTLAASCQAVVDPGDPAAPVQQAAAVPPPVPEQNSEAVQQQDSMQKDVHQEHAEPSSIPPAAA